MQVGRQSEHDARVLRFKQALRLALVAWPAFALVDLAVAYALGGRIWVYLLTRALGMFALAGAALLLRADASSKTLWSVDATVTGLLAAMVSVQAHEVDGIASPLATGVMLILLGHAALLGDSWGGALLPIGLAAASYPVTVLFLGGLTGTLASHSADCPVTSWFALDGAFLLGESAVALLYGYTL